MEHLKYPIGRFDFDREYTVGELEDTLVYLSQFPSILKQEIEELQESVLNFTYREQGWNIRQLVHHLADSHANFYIRVKLALTEDNPVIKGYEEGLWAGQTDYDLPLEVPLAILSALHLKIVALYRVMDKETLERTYYHPEWKRKFRLLDVVQQYAWHSKHHLAHIRIARSRSL